MFHLLVVFVRCLILLSLNYWRNWRKREWEWMTGCLTPSAEKTSTRKRIFLRNKNIFTISKFQRHWKIILKRREENKSPRGVGTSTTSTTRVKNSSGSSTVTNWMNRVYRFLIRRENKLMHRFRDERRRTDFHEFDNLHGEYSIVKFQEWLSSSPQMMKNWLTNKRKQFTVLKK